MYRLTIVAGPNRGMTYPIAEGETSVGRHTGNEVVLFSSQVSKRHCVLVASNGKLLVRDEGSANGTFVNGALVRSRQLSAGDRVSVGNFVFEISDARAKRKRVSLALEGLPQNVMEFPAPSRSQPGLPPGAPGDRQSLLGIGGASGIDGLNSAGSVENDAHAMPKDLKGKALWYFENYLMPVFYGFNLKQEWRAICMVSFVGFLLLNILISVQPLLDANYQIILNESGRRAAFMAREIAERNTQWMSSGAEGKTEIGLAENAENVSVALLLDLDQRIIAPSNKAGQFMVKGAESRVLNTAIRRYRGGEEREIVSHADDNVIAVAPVKIFNPRTNKNSVVAVAVVVIDASVAAMSMGDVGVVYSQVFILTALVGALMLLILYRLTLKPFQVLNEDMDKVLKGDLSQVTHEFKMEELNPLWDLINSALQRIPKINEKNDLDADEAAPDQFVGPLRMIAELAGVALVVCGADRKIAYANTAFEELSGIRVDQAVGQDISNVARDQSLSVLAADLFDRAQPGGDPVSEDYDFSGVSCTVQASAFGKSSDPAKAYAIAIIRKAE